MWHELWTYPCQVTLIEHLNNSNIPHQNDQSMHLMCDRNLCMEPKHNMKHHQTCHLFWMQLIVYMYKKSLESSSTYARAVDSTLLTALGLSCTYQIPAPILAPVITGSSHYWPLPVLPVNFLSVTLVGNSGPDILDWPEKNFSVCLWSGSQLHFYAKITNRVQ